MSIVFSERELMQQLNEADALRLRGELPRHRALIGIEPADMNWGTEPTESVAAAVPEAAAAAHDLVRSWRAEAPAEVRT